MAGRAEPKANAEENDALRVLLLVADDGLSLLPRFFAAAAPVSSLRGVVSSAADSAALYADTMWPPCADGKYEAALLLSVSIRALLAVRKLAYSASLNPRPRFAISAFKGEISSGEGADATLPVPLPLPLYKDEEEAEEGV